MPLNRQVGVGFKPVTVALPTDGARPKFIPDPHFRRRALSRRIQAEDVGGQTSVGVENEPQLMGEITLIEGTGIDLSQNTPQKEITIASLGQLGAYGSVFYDDDSRCGAIATEGLACGDCASNYQPVADVFDGPSYNITPSGTFGTLTMTKDGVYLVQFDLTFSSTGLSVGWQVFGHIFENGNRTYISAMKSYDRDALPVAYYNIKAQSLISLSANDVIDTRCSIFGPEGSRTLDILYYHLNAILLGTEIDNPPEP